MGFVLVAAGLFSARGFVVPSRRLVAARRRALVMDVVVDDGAKIPKRKVALLMGYKGSGYYGLQRQPDDEVPTIESELVRALAAARVVSEANAGDLGKIGWSRAARTDKRVSAARQVVAGKLQVGDGDLEGAIARINAALPPEIRVFDAVRVTKGFDTKRACDRRRYAYMLPSIVLASPALVDAAFGEVGRDDAAVERMRGNIIEAKKRRHSYDWGLTDDERASVARRLASFRVSDDVVARLRDFLKGYLGTQNYHNFTSRINAHSDQAKRYVIAFDASPPFSFDENDGAEWLQLSVVGQSFMLHQIRKMVAVAAEASRTSRHAGDILSRLCDPDVDVPLQLVPGDGLYLGEPIFATYNKYKADPNAGRLKLDWSPGHPKFDVINEFRRDVVEAGILHRGDPRALGPWVDYLWMLKVFGFPLSPDDPRHEVNDSPDDGTRVAWYAHRAAVEKKFPPVLLINGWGGAARDWGGLVRRLSQFRDVVCFDQRGVGGSEVPWNYSVRLMANDARAVASDVVADAPCDVVGFSLGGLVAQQLVFDYPEAVRRLALCSTSPGGKRCAEYVSTDFFDVLDDYEDSLCDDDDDAASHADRVAREKQRRRAAAAFFVNGLPTPWVASRVDALKKVVDRFVDPTFVARPAKGIHGQKQAVLKFNAADADLAAVTAPTLVLHGDVDPVLDPHCATLLLSSIPNATILLLAGVGHHAYIQEPLEWLQAILDFFDDDAK
ncbi:hypothetical protein CTAYLR_004663 [Chrysophaeum taylorii]|uniref:Pseudouridine synthase I TruA alpha/beta domain-containing protein n=1 Tax=Chrysophaeum taylorii TaxID=2483200 RepID=A0AAD7U911_9STRA|nr:hypothetical protein CTAYLR_004663 [Chrysophaeum taylorii]